MAKPVLNYAIYLLTIFALLVIIVVGVNGSNLDNYCPAKEIDCQVYLSQGQKSPYRTVKAPYTGWHYGGHAKVPGCWAGYPQFCSICDDTQALRAQACQAKYPGFSSRPGSGVPMKSATAK